MPAPGFEAYGEPASYPGESTSESGNSDPSEAENAKLQKLCYQGPEVNLEHLKWRVINGPFISVWLHNVPWGAEDTMAAPDAKVGFVCSSVLFLSHTLCFLNVIMGNIFHGFHGSDGTISWISS